MLICDPLFGVPSPPCGPTATAVDWVVWDIWLILTLHVVCRPNGTDLTRFKNVLFSAKSKNVPITSKTAV